MLTNNTKRSGKRNRLRMEIAEARTQAKMALDRVIALQNQEVRMLEDSLRAILAELNQLPGRRGRYYVCQGRTDGGKGGRKLF